jgi:hypothetical protein
MQRWKIVAPNRAAFEEMLALVKAGGTVKLLNPRRRLIAVEGLADDLRADLVAGGALVSEDTRFSLE